MENILVSVCKSIKVLFNYSMIEILARATNWYKFPNLYGSNIQFLVRNGTGIIKNCRFGTLNTVRIGNRTVRIHPI